MPYPGDYEYDCSYSMSNAGPLESAEESIEVMCPGNVSVSERHSGNYQEREAAGQQYVLGALCEIKACVIAVGALLDGAWLSQFMDDIRRCGHDCPHDA